MDVPTITIPDWGTFKFVRSTDPVHLGRGDWVVVSARSSNLKPNMILSDIEQRDLTEIAKERGLTEVHNFFRSPPPKPERDKSGRRTRVPGGSKKDPNIFTGFNPFHKSAAK